MMTQKEWQHINAQRAQIYLWFGALFSMEQTKEQLAQYQGNELQGLYDLFTELGLDKEMTRFTNAMSKALQDEHAHIELAADFAQHFLLDEKVSALPYASYYLENKRLYGDVESKMREFLKDNALSINADFKEPADHLAVYLYLMAHWIKRANDYDHRDAIFQDQSLFLNNGLLSWLPSFVRKSQKQKLKYDVYPALTAVLLAFIEIDVALFAES